jgi:hypothetical protein
LFADQMRQEIKKHMRKCGSGDVIWGRFGETFPSTVSGPTAIPDTSEGAEPCESAPGNQSKPNQGETYKPSLADGNKPQVGFDSGTSSSPTYVYPQPGNPSSASPKSKSKS